MRGHAQRGDHRRTAIIGIAGAVMLASLAGACLATSRATEPVVGNGPLPPPPSAGPAAAQRPPRSFTVVATGEILPAAPVAGVTGAGDAGTATADGLERTLRPIAPMIGGADLALCRLDTPLAPARGPYPARLAPGSPSWLPAALAGLGYDACSTASRRALDTGAAGVARTLESLDRAGLRHAGTTRGAAAAATPAIMEVRGVRVALLSSTSGRPAARVPRALSWLVNRTDPVRILAAAHRARRAGARVVILALSWGKENARAATAEQIALARRLLADRDVDLIVGGGTGVVQPFGRGLNGKFVAYGMGRVFPAPGRAGRDPGAGAGIVARFTFTRVNGAWRVTRAEFVPTFADRGPPPRVVDVTAELADPRLTPARRRVLQGVLRRTMRTVYSRGAAPFLAR
jgi:hypothetical protein